MRFLNAIGFLTIIKIPEKFYLRQEEYPKVLVHFPVVGVIVGLLSSIVFFAFNLIFPLILSIIIMVGFEIIITGGIHIDGIADTTDGIFSGEKERKKILEIMKKGDVGVFGVLAIIFSIALKVALYYFIAAKLNVSWLVDPGSGILDTTPPDLVLSMKEFYPGFMVFLAIIIFAPVYGRLSMLYMFSRYKPAEVQKSLTGAFRDKGNREVFILSAVYISIVFITANVLAGLGFMQSTFGLDLETSAFIYAIQGILIIALTMLISSAAGMFFVRRTGGLNGDVIGAVCIVTEVAFLFLNYISLIFI